MSSISMSQGEDGLWSLCLPGLVITDLSKEAADEIAATYGRVVHAAREKTDAG
ncbi:hypothetical protein [Methylobacterium sp. SD21]|uniref:hypothetical protein n=1 Tax=Methylobacterium litchii TaxID=3138810 RepID=UPI00313B6145